MASHINFQMVWCRNLKKAILPNMHIVKLSHCSTDPRLFIASKSGRNLSCYLISHVIFDGQVVLHD